MLRWLMATTALRHHRGGAGMTACTWPHCGCNSTQGNHCRAPSVRADLSPALAVPEVAALVEAANWQTKARAQHWLRRNMSAPEDAEVEALCEKYGYGAVMDAASRLWARKPYGSGAFYVGGCIGFKSDEEALAALRGEGQP